MVIIVSQYSSTMIRKSPQVTRKITGLQYTIAPHNIQCLNRSGVPVVKCRERYRGDRRRPVLLPAKDTLSSITDGLMEITSAVEVIRLIEKMGFKHTGAAADSIELCINKPRTKERLTQNSIPTPKYQVFDHAAGEFHLNFPVIIKPSVEDASMGIDLGSVVSNQENLFQRIAYVVEKYEQPAIVEEFVSGRELAVAMWGNEDAEMLLRRKISPGCKSGWSYPYG
jgi:D-alanine-D-alanine ligase